MMGYKMPMPISFRFDDVCHALGVKAPTVRRWLQFGLIGNMAKGKSRDGWVLGFACHDLAVLALLKPMTEFGVPVSAAHKIATRALREHAGPWADDEALSVWWTAWAPSTQINITRKSTESGKVTWALAVFEDADETGWTSPAHLSLNPHRIIRETFERAVASAEARLAQADKRSA